MGGFAIDRWGHANACLQFVALWGETPGLRLTVNNLVRVAGPLLFGFIASALGLLPVFLINALMMGLGAVVSRPEGRQEGGRMKAEG